MDDKTQIPTIPTPSGQVTPPSLTTSFEEDLPLSEVVSTIRSTTPPPTTINQSTAPVMPPTPQSPAAPVIPQPTTQIGTPATTPPISPSALTPSPKPAPPPETPKSPLYEDPDKVKTIGA